MITFYIKIDLLGAQGVGGGVQGEVKYFTHTVCYQL